MAEELDEVADITAICAGLNLNMGTISKPKIESMLIAGKKANALHHPIVLDPVDVGISKLRMDTAMRFLQEIQFTVIRGNVSEIKKLALDIGAEKGVDAAEYITEENIDEIVVLTGALDIVADSEKACCIRNGHPMMSSITGTGCQLSAMIATYRTNIIDAIYNMTTEMLEKGAKYEVR